MQTEGRGSLFRRGSYFLPKKLNLLSLLVSALSIRFVSVRGLLRGYGGGSPSFYKELARECAPSAARRSEVGLLIKKKAKKPASRNVQRVVRNFPKISWQLLVSELASRAGFRPRA